MKRIWMGLMAIFLLLAGCASSQNTPGGDGEIVETATSNEPPPSQMATAAPANTQLTSTDTVVPTETMPAPSETPIPTESQPTPVSPFTAASIEPGQQKAFSFQSSSGEEILYWLYVPEGYDQDRTWPLILSLHGTLGFEPSLDRVSEQSPQTLINPEVTFPFIVISPQAPNGPWSQYHAPVDELIGYLGESLSIDPEAQFLTGLSTGAIGAWQWALAKPDRFAGVASIAGGISTNPNDPLPENICLLKDLPVWIAISEIDERVPVESVHATVAALEECGSTVVQFTAYADLNHGESFTMAFAGPELYDWMLGLME